MHIFPYSRRPGTPADKLPAQCKNAVKAARAHEASLVAAELHADFLRQSVGQTLPVLFETEEDGLWQGHSDTYLPVKAPGEGLRGQICPVRIDAVEGEALKGRIV
jgi:threonylcarbamoyladenosine tRNA methylthiotransferase MtaB